MNEQGKQWNWSGTPPTAPSSSQDDATAAFPATSVPTTERLPTAAPAQSYETVAPPIVLRRARPAVFIAPEPDEGHVVSRDVGLGRGLSKQSELSRNRKIAGNLPAWDPLPPGEIHVVSRRPAGGS